MKSKIVQDSFYGSLVTFFVNYFFGLSHLAPALVITAFIFPGLIFGLVLVRSSRVKGWKSLAFIVLSGGLHYTIAWLATDDLDSDLRKTFPIAGFCGAIVLYLLYKILVNRTLSIRQSFLFSLMIGILSAAPAFFVYWADKSRDEWIYYAGLFSIFIIWQTVFGLGLKKATLPQEHQQAPR